MGAFPSFLSLLRRVLCRGFARNMDWTFVEGESSDGKCVLELVDSEETKKAEEHPWVRPDTLTSMRFHGTCGRHYTQTLPSFSNIEAGFLVGH